MEWIDRRRPSTRNQRWAIAIFVAAILGAAVVLGANRAPTPDEGLDARGAATVNAAGRLAGVVAALERAAAHGPQGAVLETADVFDQAVRAPEYTPMDRLPEDPDRQAAIDRMRTAVEVTEQAGGEPPLLVLAAPVYAAPLSIEVADRRASFRGFLELVVDVERVLQPGLDGIELVRPLRLDVRAATAPTGEQLQVPVSDRILAVAVAPQTGSGPALTTWVALAAALAAGLWLWRSSGRPDEPPDRLVDEVVAHAASAPEPATLLPRTLGLLRERYGLAGVTIIDVAGQPSFQVGSRLRDAPTTVIGLPNEHRARWRLELATHRPLTGADLNGLVSLAPLLAAFVDQAHSLEERRQRNESLERQDERRTEFLSEVSHELRNNVTALAGLASVLDSRWDHLPDDARRDLAGRIERNAETLTAHVRDLLDLARLDRGAVSLNVEDVDIAVLCGELVEAASPSHSCHALNLQIDRVPARATADSYALQRVLTNLIDNACKYSPSGGAITVGVGERDGRVEMWVEDDGPGVAVDERERIFERFYRGQLASVARGTGIGLAVVKGLCEAMAATVEVGTSSMGGARFSVLLAARPRDEEESERHARA